jgi:hypothetical protein
VINGINVNQKAEVNICKDTPNEQVLATTIFSSGSHFCVVTQTRAVILELPSLT